MSEIALDKFSKRAMKFIDVTNLLTTETMKKSILTVLISIGLFSTALMAGSVSATSSWQSSTVAAEIDCKSRLRSLGGNPNRGLSIYGYQIKTKPYMQYKVSCRCSR